jgi:hypothetical protein
MLANLMFNTVNVNRPTPTKGTSGAQKNTYTTVYSSLPCSVQPVTATWQVLYSQRHIDVTHSVFFNSNPTIQAGDQIVFGSLTLMVQGIRDLISLQRVLVVDCLQIE